MSEQHKQRRKKEIKDKVNNYLNGLQEIGLEPVSLHLKTQDEQHISVKLGLENESACYSNHDDIIPSLLYLLLKHGISNECYHEITMLVPELPKSYKVAIAIS